MSRTLLVIAASGLWFGIGGLAVGAIGGYQLAKRDSHSSHVSAAETSHVRSPASVNSDSGPGPGVVQPAASQSARQRPALTKSQARDELAGLTMSQVRSRLGAPNQRWESPRMLWVYSEVTGDPTSGTTDAFLNVEFSSTNPSEARVTKVW